MAFLKRELYRQVRAELFERHGYGDHGARRHPDVRYYNRVRARP
jgi:hypothetical protein